MHQNPFVSFFELDVILRTNETTGKY